MAKYKIENTRWFENGNLPKLNSLNLCLHNMQHGLRIATGNHELDIGTTDIIDSLRKLCDATVNLIGWLDTASGHISDCDCQICTATDKLWEAWCGLDIDISSDEPRYKTILSREHRRKQNLL